MLRQKKVCNINRANHLFQCKNISHFLRKKPTKYKNLKIHKENKQILQLFFSFNITSTCINSLQDSGHYDHSEKIALIAVCQGSYIKGQ